LDDASRDNTMGESIAVLDGEVAVPCNPQSAIAGSNSGLEAHPL